MDDNNGIIHVFSDAIETLSQRLADSPQPFSRIEGAVTFRVPEEIADVLLQEMHQELLNRGLYFFRAASYYGTQPDALVLMQTDDKYEVIRAMGTNGANCDVSTDDIIDWLHHLEREQPFVLTGIGVNFLEGNFTQPLGDPGKWAMRMEEFCPDIVYQGAGTVDALAKELKRSNRLFFWWD